MKYWIIGTCMSIALLTACTLSFQNISTNGKATDVVDENQDASPTVDAKIDVPVTP